MNYLGITIPAAVIAISTAGVLVHRSRSTRPPLGKLSRLVVLAGVLTWPIIIGVIALGEFSYSRNVWIWWLPQGIRHTPWFYSMPLIWGIIAVAFWFFAAAPTEKAVDAELFPRTLLTFVPRRRSIIIAIMIGLVLLVSVVAGLNAVSTGDGKTMQYEFGLDGTARTLTYGWYSSVPSLALLAVLLGVALFVMSKISRPAIGPNRERDIEERRYKSAIVATTVAGSVAMHASLVFMEAAGAASLRAGVLVGGQSIEVGGPFAVFAPMLVVAGILSSAYGVGAWSYLMWLGISQTQRRKVTSIFESDN